MATIKDIIKSIRPGAEWVIIGDTYEGINWLDTIQTKPSATEVASAKVILEIEEVKEISRNIARDIFNTEVVKDITALGYTWQGGYDSAIRLDAARRLAEAAGQTTVTLHDVSHLPRVLSLAEVLQVVLTISQAFQTAFGIKQAELARINAS